MSLKKIILFAASTMINYGYAVTPQTIYAPVYTCQTVIPKTVTCQQSTNSYFPQKVMITDGSLGYFREPEPFYPYQLYADGDSIKPAKVRFLSFKMGSAFVANSLVNLCWGNGDWTANSGTDYDAACQAPLTPTGYRECGLSLYSLRHHLLG